MAAVSAGDINKTDADTDVLTVSNNDVLVDSVDSGTFIELQEKINNASEGSTIELSNNYTYDDTFNAGGIIINKSLTIEGNGFTINAANQARIFFINATNNIVLNNIVFANAKSQQGGAILFEKAITNVSITNSVFTNNSLSDNGYAGGAINFNDDVSMALFENDTFENNYAPSGFGGSITFDKNANLIAFDGCDFKVTKPREGNINGGGAIYFIGNATFVDMENCEFNNFTVLTGGAIFVEKELSNSMFFNNKFINNTALNNKTKYGGGAIAVEGNASNNIFNATSFIMNSAATHGGAVKFMNNDIGNVFVNCTFADNFAPYGGSIAASNNSERLYLIDSTFTMTGETSDEIIGGGAIYFINDVNQLLISGCEFDSLTARTGGAVYIEGNLNTGLINGTKFKNNKATTNNTYYGGGAIAIEGNANYTIIMGSEFTNNTALTHGGAIKFRGNNSNIAIASSKFNDNYAPIAGGISLGNTESLIISRSEFNDNKGTNRDIVGGGALYVIGNLTKARIINSKFINNSARTGGAIYVEGNMDQSIINNTYFENNTAFTNNTYYGGGAIAVQGDATNNAFILEKFASNTATTHGGAVKFMGNDKNNTFDSCIFINNYAPYGGSIAVSNMSEDLSLIRCIFTTDEDLMEAPMEIIGGGALYFINDANRLFINDCEFTSLTARAGGAIYVEGDLDNALINSSYFMHNKATTNQSNYGGGAIDVEGNAEYLFVTESTFGYNTASTAGGAIMLKSNNDLLAFFKSTFDANYAPYAGAIFLGNTEELLIYESNFTNSKGTDSDIIGGGALYVLGNLTSAYVAHSLFENNSARAGGAIFVEGDMDQWTFENDTFNNNSAFTKNTLYGGGAISVEGDATNNIFHNSVFTLNSDTNHGGNIYFMANAINNTISECEFRDNAGGYGGALAVYKNTENLNISNCNFTMQGEPVQRIVGGGALYFINNVTDLNIDNCLFSGYTARTGGAIFFEKTVEKTVIENSIFKNNEITTNNKKYGGGAIYIENNASDFTIRSCGFLDNIASTFGGAIFIKNAKDFLIDDVLFSDNDAQQGKAIYLINGDNVTIQNSYFESTGLGADIYYAGEINSSVINSTFEGSSNIILGESAFVRLSDNTEVGSYEYGDYFVYSKGVLYLEGNDLSNAIYNDGEIISPTLMIIGYNETVNTTSSLIYLTAKCLDDSYNYIVSDYGIFYINDLVYKICYNDDLLCDLFYLWEYGSYLINATTSGLLSNCTYKYAIVNYIPPKEANISADDIVLDVGQYGEIEVELPEDAAGTVSAYINDEIYLAKVKNGKATIIFPPLESGEYEALIAYSGGDSYQGNYTTVLITVLEGLTVEAPDVTKYYHGPERFVVNVTKSGKALNNATVEITINGATYTRQTDENGTASIGLGLPSGNYTATVKVDDTTVNSTVTILPTVNGTDITKVYRNATQYYATFLDSEGNYLKEGTNVTFNINGVFYNRTISGDKGLARLNINLEQGEYIITAINPNTTEQASNTIIVIPRIVDNHDIVKYFRNATQYTATILGDDGNPVGKGKIVKFNINGVFYERETNESGQVKLNLNLNPGDYIITAEYEGSMVSNNVTVLPTLTAEDLTKKYGADDPFEAKLVDGSGNPYGNQIIEFNINGVFYNRTTDSSGIAKLNINLQAGEYIITSKYGDATISNKVTIIA